MAEDFPRGNNFSKKKNENLSKKRLHLEDILDEDDELFAKTSKKSKLDDKFKPFFTEVFPNMLVLGCVKEVRDYEVFVSLPDDVTGKFGITEISNGYKEILQKLAGGKDFNEDFKLLSLHEIFHLGSIVRCIVLNNSNSKFLKLSVNPTFVNKDILELKPGMTISGVVSSVEDHGYIMDVGKKNVKVFLPKNDASKWVSKYKSVINEEIEVSVGSYFNLFIKKSSNSENVRSYFASIDPSLLSNRFSPKLSLHSLTPGSLLFCEVEKVDSRGLFLKIGSHKGIIPKRYVKENLKSYKEDDVIKSTLLYLQPSSNILILSLLPHHIQNLSFSKLTNYERGQMIYNAKYIKYVSNLGFIFKMADGVKGCVKQDQIEKRIDKEKTFIKSQIYSCRVVGFNFFDNMVYLSFKKNIMENRFFCYHDLKVGQMVECQVEKMNRSGLVVKVGKLKTFIPNIHLSDVPLSDPASKFKPGKKMKCRVLFCDSEKGKVILTRKRLLLKPKFHIPINYSSLKIGTMATGFIGSIKEKGIVVIFGGEVKGWVPSREATYQKSDLSKLFYIGQVVNCKILDINIKLSKLLLTFNTKRIEKKNHLENDNKEGKDIENINLHRNIKKSSENEIELQADEKKELKMKRQNQCLEILKEKPFNWEEEQNEEITEENDNQEENSELMKKITKYQFNSLDEKMLDLEREVMLKPHESKAWLELAAFKVENGDVSLSREVFKKGLKALPYWDEEEKLKLWKGWINLEFQYGNEESLDEIFTEAMRFCDKKKIQFHLKNIYETNGKIEKAVDLCKDMIKRNKIDPEVWLSFGSLLYKNEKVEQARLLLNDALEKLVKKSHLEVTSKFALLESKYGVVDRAETMFEDIVKNFPSRTDIWSIYVDMCIKQERIEQARNILKRASELKLSSKKMKFLLKKYLIFEENFGYKEDQLEIKQKLKELEKS